MPHISIKMLKGRTDAQKAIAADKVSQALCEAIGCNKKHVSVSVEDFTPEEWQNVYKEEIVDGASRLVITPDYNPADMLKK